MVKKMQYVDFRARAYKSLEEYNTKMILDNYTKYSKLYLICSSIKGMTIEPYIESFYNGHSRLYARITMDNLFKSKSYVDEYNKEREKCKGAWFTPYRGTTWQRVLCKAEELAPLKLSKDIYGEEWECDDTYIDIPISKIKAI